MNEKLTMVIASDSCNGEEEQFLAWMEKNHPEIDSTIENVLHGGMTDENDNHVEENYWDKYCSE